MKYRLAGGLPIADLVQLYMEEGKAEHVRPELAFAYSIIETGSLGNALDSNYAGIGARDSRQGEPPRRDGVRADPAAEELRRSDVARRLANRRRRRSTAPGAAVSYDTFFAKGVRRRGTRWATATGH